MQATGTYGHRGRLRTIETGIRLVAPTYGRARIRTSSAKTGDILVDSQAERFITHLVAIDPCVNSCKPQPFTVDLVTRQLLTDPMQRLAAKSKYSKRKGSSLYTPDFCIHWSGARRTALEIKTSAFPGDAEYQKKLALAAEVLSAYGYELATVTLSEHMYPLKANLQLLQQAQRTPAISLSTEQHDALSQLKNENLTLGDFCTHLGCPLHDAPRLLLQAVIGMNLFAYPMRADTPTYLTHGDMTHLCLMQEVLS